MIDNYKTVFKETLDVTDKNHLFKVEESSLVIGVKPSATDILDIYASKAVNNMSRQLLSVKQEK